MQTSARPAFSCVHHLVHEMLSMAYTASTLSKNAIYKKCYDKEPWENMWIKTQGDPDGLVGV